MRKLIMICLMMAMGITSKAQTKGPTKEETIDYIRSFFTNHSTEIERPIGYLTLSKNYRFDINNTVVRINYESWDGSALINNEVKYTDNLLEFDLKEIERVTLTSGKVSNKCGYSIIFMAFNGKNTIKSEGGKKSSASFPLYGKGIIECDSDLSGEKILKAFKHLRKLCGAPEPISFD